MLRCRGCNSPGVQLSSNQGIECADEYVYMIYDEDEDAEW